MQKYRVKNTVGFFMVLFFVLSLSSCGAGSSAGRVTDLSVDDSIADDSIADDSDVPGLGVVTLSWTPPIERTDGTVMDDLVGYRIYYGNEPDALANVIDLDNLGVSSYVLENLDTGVIYYFGMTAIDSNNVESAMSEVVSKQL